MNGDFKYKIYLYFGIKQEEMFDESCILIPLLLSLMKINLIFTDTIPILFKYILSNKGLSLSLDKLTSEVTLQLLNKLGVTPFLLDSQCNRDKEPYIPVKDRWNNGNLIGKLFSSCNVTSDVSLSNDKLNPLFDKKLSSEKSVYIKQINIIIIFIKNHFSILLHCNYGNITYLSKLNPE
jgi:hypothetical protein